MKRTLVTLGVSLALVTVILLAGNVIVIGDKLAAASPVLAWVFYGLLAGALVWLVVIPTCRILFAKPFPKLSVDPAAEDTPELRRELKSFARSLADNLGDLPAEEAAARRSELLAQLDRFYDLAELRGIIQGELDRRFAKAQEHIHQWAKTVFLVTTVSQVGRIDAITSLVINCRMIADVIRCSGYRPTWGQLGRQYARILATSLFSYYLSDALDKVEVDPEMLQLKALSNMPLVGTVTKSLVDGTANTLLSLRIGHVTLAYLREGAQALSGKSGAKVRRRAMLDAVKSFLVLSRDTTISGLSLMGQKLDAWINGEKEQPAEVPAEVTAFEVDVGGVAQCLARQRVQHSGQCGQVGLLCGSAARHLRLVGGGQRDDGQQQGKCLQMFHCHISVYIVLDGVQGGIFKHIAAHGPDGEVVAVEVAGGLA